jgi:hypothetical protein
MGAAQLGKWRPRVTDLAAEVLELLRADGRLHPDPRDRMEGWCVDAAEWCVPVTLTEDVPRMNHDTTATDEW